MPWAPLSISLDAATSGFSAGASSGLMLRERTNDRTCFTDWPVAPSNDPMCNDTVFAAWMDAFYAGEKPQITQPGVSYIRMGGDDTSNTDLFAPAADGEWIYTPPHMMVVVPGGLNPEVFSTDHTSSSPTSRGKACPMST